MRPPAGWMIVFVGSCNVASSADALVESRVTFAAESRRAVVLRFGGLVQPEFENKLFTRLLLIKWQWSSVSAGVPCHFLPHVLFHMHPPCSSPRFAVRCCL